MLALQDTWLHRLPTMADELASWALFEVLDNARRFHGIALDALGLGPSEAPYTTIFRRPGASLRRYSSGSGRDPAVVIIPAPIKRSYIWDLTPACSAVRRLLAAHAAVFLIDWESTGEALGLAEYADRLIYEALAAAGIDQAVLLGHSLGGLFAAVFAALHPERVRGLGLLATPLHSEPGIGIFGTMENALPARGFPSSVPGSFLSAASLRAAPVTFGWGRLLDFAVSLPRPEALRTHLRVERWTLDEFSLPGRLLTELAEHLARDDAFVRGTLTVGGHLAVPSQVTAPLLCVVDPRCRVVPPEAVLPFFEAAGSIDKTLLHYEGDIGVSLQHVGLLIGPRAHARLWPEIARWVTGARRYIP
jgi:polyhydroxyalkanoate synthase subunit PhaC